MEVHSTEITRDNALEFKVHEWICEASDIGIRPGQWPKRIPTTLGNKLQFVFREFEMYHGEIAAALYAQDLGCITLKVHND